MAGGGCGFNFIGTDFDGTFPGTCLATTFLVGGVLEGDGTVIVFVGGLGLCEVGGETVMLSTFISELESWVAAESWVEDSSPSIAIIVLLLTVAL